jgi:hypothetical protein
MRAGSRLAIFSAVGCLCLGSLAHADSPVHHQKKAKKPELPAIPSGPQGPLQHQIPLDSIPSVPPQVSYQNGQLTIVALNSSLSDILRAVRKQTAAEMEIPATASERVVTNLGPGPAREIVAELLNGSRFNYVILGSPADPTLMTRVVLVAKPGTDAPAVAANGQPQPGPPGRKPAMAAVQPDADAAEAPEADDSADAAADDADAADSEQPADTGDQQAVKTPQQMLQEMQQRQQQLQQQQGQTVQPGQPPAGYPPPGGVQPPQRPAPDQ